MTSHPARRPAKIGCWVGLLIAPLSACARDEAPGIRQLSCTGISKPDESMILLLDLGRHTVVQANGIKHPTLMLDADRYTYRFHDGAGVKVTISRYNGRMMLERTRGKPTAEIWTCKAVKAEQSL